MLDLQKFEVYGDEKIVWNCFAIFMSYCCDICECKYLLSKRMPFQR